MLRITLHDELDRVTLKLEGNLVGIWVTELEIAWRSAVSGLAGRSLHLDLRAVDHVDRAGTFLLALLRQRGVKMAVSGTVLPELVRSIDEEWLHAEDDAKK